MLTSASILIVLERGQRYTVYCDASKDGLWWQFRLQYDEQAQGTLGSMMATPSLLSRVIESQAQDTELVSIRAQIQSGIADEGWAINTDGSLQYRGRVVVPQSTDLREEILREFHCSRFTVHPGGTKMYHDLRCQYY